MTFTIKSNYRVLGLNNGPESPLIWLIHGAGGDLHHYDTVVPGLIEGGFRVVLNDVHFHGLSQPVGDEADINAATFEFSDVIKGMDIILKEVKGEHYPDHAIHLFMGGLSMGGMISLLYASDKGHSDIWKEDQIELKGLILLAAGIPYMEVARPGWEMYRTRQATQQVFEWTKSAIILSSINESGQKEVKRAMDLVSDHALYECFVAIATLLPNPSTPPKEYQLLTTVPVLLISPDQDPYTKEEMEKLHELNLQHGVHSEITTISDAGHMVILDKGPEIGIKLRNFCSNNQ